MTEYENLDYLKTKAFCEVIFTSYGFTAADADGISDILLRADLYGIESHGIQRLIRYHNAKKNGEFDVCARLEIVHETMISATIAANKTMGQVVSRYAMELAIKKAKQIGIGMVAVRDSTHYGIAGYYAKMAADADLIGVCMTNTEAIMVPTFAKKGMLGTNPISVAMPADPTPFLFDSSTTVVTRGKLEVYSKREKTLPDGWALDASGHNSSDVSDVLKNIIGKLGGGIAPLGGAGEETAGYKGYGFGLVCELFTSIMAGGLTSPYCATEKTHRISHCFWAIDYGVFGDKAAIKKEFSILLQELRDTSKANGQNRVYIHGEKELESYTKKLREGISINERTFDEIKQIAVESNIDYRQYIGDSF